MLFSGLDLQMKLSRMQQFVSSKGGNMSSNLNSSEFTSKRIQQKTYGNPPAHSPTSSDPNSAGNYGVRVAIKAELCSGCGDCIQVCPEHALRISDSVNPLGTHPVQYSGQSCNGCGICVNVCAISGAIRIYRRFSVC